MELKSSDEVYWLKISDVFASVRFGARKLIAEYTVYRNLMNAEHLCVVARVKIGEKLVVAHHVDSVPYQVSMEGLLDKSTEILQSVVFKDGLEF